MKHFRLVTYFRAADGAGAQETEYVRAADLGERIDAKQAERRVTGFSAEGISEADFVRYTRGD